MDARLVDAGQGNHQISLRRWINLDTAVALEPGRRLRSIGHQKTNIGPDGREISWITTHPIILMLVEERTNPP